MTDANLSSFLWSVADLLRKSGQHFYNTSPLDLKKLVGDQDHIGENLRAYLQAFSPAVRDIFEHFDFHTQIDRLQKANLLYLVAEKFGYRTITVERPERDAKGKVVLGTKVGYEIPFNRHFYVFKPPRPLAEIDKEPKVVTDRILKMIGGLSQ
jgi:type I restriction-modification system DNA methylase subunit